MVGFGATGDLMRLKVIPALFLLHVQDELPHMFRFVGFSRRDWSDVRFRAYVREIINGRFNDAHEADVASFLERFNFENGEFSDQKSFDMLKASLQALDAKWGVCSNKIFYLAVAPAFYEQISHELSRSGLADGCSLEEGWMRVIIEKPFGQDGESATRLEALLSKFFKEEQIYRIDHYLGKKVLQDIFSFRFDDGQYEDVWDAEHIECIAIRTLENIGAEKRGAFYDAAGTLRDVGQNHLLEIVALLTMEQPSARTSEAVCDARASAIERLQPIAHDAMARETFRAQYEGFRGIIGVAPDSITETYFKIRVRLDTPRWHGVPIVIEAGKRLAAPQKEIIVRFKDGSERRFDFNATVQYTEEYERLLLDAIRGDQTHFVSEREIEAAWRFVDPIERAWRSGTELVPLHMYQPGTNDILLQANF